MTTLKDRPHSALLVVDVQNDVVAGSPNRDEVVANISTLVEQGAQRGIPVIWVQHHDDDLPQGSDGGSTCPKLQREDRAAGPQGVGRLVRGDRRSRTCWPQHKVGRLVVTGAQTDACIRSTLHGAITRGYDATLVSDAHTTEDLDRVGRAAPDVVIAHTNLVLEAPRGAGPQGRHRHHRRGRVLGAAGQVQPRHNPIHPVRRSREHLGHR